jgi:high-affinity Fe2+/Pb2+ permease
MFITSIFSTDDLTKDVFANVAVGFVILAVIIFIFKYIKGRK